MVLGAFIRSQLDHSGQSGIARGVIARVGVSGMAPDCFLIDRTAS